jgi:HK97 family phage prohead protease
VITLVVGYKKSEVDSRGKFYGYASVFNVEDSYGDVILNGAFSKTIKNRASSLRLLWQHSSDGIVGEIETIWEDIVGLYVSGKIHLDDKLGERVYCYIVNNVVNGLSIGYSVDSCTFDALGRRIIKAISLFEISIVTLPANKFCEIISCSYR